MKGKKGIRRFSEIEVSFKGNMHPVRDQQFNKNSSCRGLVNYSDIFSYWTPNLTVLNQFQPEAERGEGRAAGGQRPDAEDRHHLWRAPGRRLPRAAPPLLLLRLLQQAPLLDGQEAVQAAIQPGRKEDIYRVTHLLAD